MPTVTATQICTGRILPLMGLTPQLQLFLLCTDNTSLAKLSVMADFSVRELAVFAKNDVKTEPDNGDCHYNDAEY